MGEGVKNNFTINVTTNTSAKYTPEAMAIKNYLLVSGMFVGPLKCCNLIKCAASTPSHVALFHHFSLL